VDGSEWNNLRYCPLTGRNIAQCKLQLTVWGALESLDIDNRLLSIRDASQLQLQGSGLNTQVHSHSNASGSPTKPSLTQYQTSSAVGGLLTSLRAN